MPTTLRTNSRSGMNSWLIALCALCGILCSCATMFSRGADEITIQSEPEGADVYDGANFLGKTPLKHSFVRETFGYRELTIVMEGRKSQKMYLAKNLEDKAMLNIGFVLTSGGITCWGIDALTGHMIKYSPDSYLIVLEKEEAAEGKKDQSYLQRLRFVVVNHDSLKKDIAKGQGEYLRAYYEIRSPDRPFDNYQKFLSRVSGQARLLLAVDDPVEFHRELEGKFHAVSVSQNGEQQDLP